MWFLQQRKTPEDVAAESGHKELAKLLADERLGAPAQLVIQHPEIETEIWIGELVSFCLVSLV